MLSHTLICPRVNIHDDLDEIFIKMLLRKDVTTEIDTRIDIYKIVVSHVSLLLWTYDDLDEISLMFY